MSNFEFKMSNFEFKMSNVLFKMSNWMRNVPGRGAHSIQSHGRFNADGRWDVYNENHGFYNGNHGYCTKRNGFSTGNDGFWWVLY